TGLKLYDEKGQVWEAALALFWKHGIPIDRGYGGQLALPLRYWTVTDGRQLPLFGEVEVA
ncbi:MAG TPA: hypothetical protein VHS28_08675, partial [Chloroflexota bacterium]|nr:hypothetical protein [Chloroflexota bacterium]